MIANVKSSNPTTYTNVVTCSFCGKLGHNESVCFKKNNFPNQEGKGPRFCSNNRRVCTYCNKIGHIVDVCYKKHGYPPRDKSQYENPLKPTISLLKRTTLVNKIRLNTIIVVIFVLLKTSFKFFQIFVKNVNISNDQAQVNQVGSISVDLQDQYSLSHVIFIDSKTLLSINMFEFWILVQQTMFVFPCQTLHHIIKLNRLLLNFQMVIWLLPLNLVQWFSMIILFLKFSYMCQ